jgi:transposase-like protein
MTQTVQLMPASELFKGRQFDQEVIVLCVRWYLNFKLSSLDLVEMMSERRIALAHTTILRWVQRYVPGRVEDWRQLHTGLQAALGTALRRGR